MAQPIQPTQTPSQVQHPVQQPAPLSAEKIRVTVRNRTQILFNEEAKSVSSKNDTGVFDILPEHSNFISLITSPLIIRKLDGTKQEITFQNGLLKVKENNVHCYIDLISQGLAK
jgi:F0F1-type ATP synthase epsilon subunit